MKRISAVLTCTFVWMLLTITALGIAPSDSHAADNVPQLLVTPSELTVFVPISTATTLTRTLVISNATSGTTLTWSIAISAGVPLSVTAI